MVGGAPPNSHPWLSPRGAPRLEPLSWGERIPPVEHPMSTVDYMKKSLAFAHRALTDARNGTPEQLHFVPANGSHSIAWCLWHTARVERSCQRPHPKAAASLERRLGLDQIPSQLRRKPGALRLRPVHSGGRSRRRDAEDADQSSYGTDSNRLVFGYNATDALNLSIFGTLRAGITQLLRN